MKAVREVLPSVGFIGGGRITKVILGGWQRAGTLPDTVVVSDVDRGALDQIAALNPTVRALENGNDEAAAQEIVFLAVHPPVIRAVSGPLANKLGPKSVVVSLAPKLTFEVLSGLLDGFRRLVRVIPNAPSLVGAGFNPVVFEKRLPPADRAIVTELLASLGDNPEVAEPELEAYAILTAIGPSYFWPQLDRLAKLACEFGLTPEAAYEGLERMLLGSVATLRTGGLSLNETMALISARPMADVEPAIIDAYTVKLRKLHDAIKPHTRSE